MNFDRFMRLAQAGWAGSPVPPAVQAAKVASLLASLETDTFVAGWMAEFDCGHQRPCAGDRSGPVIVARCLLGCNPIRIRAVWEIEPKRFPCPDAEVVPW